MNKLISFIEWTSLAIKAFLDTRESTRTVPTLYFLNLCTDTSDFSAGGYFFQTVDDIERPVSFLSRAFVDTQVKRVTIQKEAFAIYFRSKNSHYIIRDRKFSILPDHKDLQHLKNSSNSVIRRWKK